MNKKASKYYAITYRDRSDPSPMAVFFMVYNRQTSAVVWESATYYNDKEMERVAAEIVYAFENDRCIHTPTEHWILNPASR